MITGSGQRTSLELADTPWNLKSATLAWRSRIVVDHPQSSHADEIYILDRRSPVPLDDFLGYQPSLSPNGKYLAFLAWYPAHFAPESLTGDFVLLYDLSKDTFANRHQPRAAFPMADDPDRQAGTQLYPPARPPPENGIKTERQILRHEIYGLTWSPDSSKLLILDSQTEGPGGSLGSPHAGATINSGNLKSFPMPPSRSVRNVVLVELGTGTPEVSTFRARVCPLISDITCSMDVAAAKFDQAGVTVTEVTRDDHGVFLRNQPIHVSYSQFESYR